MEKERQKPKLDLKQIQEVSKVPSISRRRKTDTWREELNLWYSPLRTRLEKHIHSNPILFAAEAFSSGVFLAVFLSLCFSGHATSRDPVPQIISNEDVLHLPQINQSYLQEPAQLSSSFQEPVLQAQSVEPMPDALEHIREQTAIITASNILMKSLKVTPRNIESVLATQKDNFTPEGYAEFLSELNRKDFIKSMVTHEGVLSALLEQSEDNDALIFSDSNHYQFILKASILFEDAKGWKEERVAVQMASVPGNSNEFKIDRFRILD